MIRRLLAIAFIFLCASVAWGILGATILARTHSADGILRGRVEGTWGAAQIQKAPTADYTVTGSHEEAEMVDGINRRVTRKRDVVYKVPPRRSDIATALALEHRQKGLQWYSTYTVDFQGEFDFQNPDAVAHSMSLAFPLPAAEAVYDNLEFLVNGQPANATTANGIASVTANLAGNQAVRLNVRYRSHGLESWRYSFGENVNQVRDFRLRMSTNFADIDFPDNTLSPVTKTRTGNGWQLEWNYTNLLSGYMIAMSMPEKLQPGLLASQISFFAPVSLFFFFFVLFIITTIRNMELHPMNYFFLAAAFFAFHLLMGYLADHMDIYAAFAVSSVVSVFLVITYLRIVTGREFAFREAGLAQFVYLVLFSFAFFFKGYTGLAITIGAILTLFVVMQMTARVRWAEKFRGAAGPPPLPAVR